MFYLHSDHSSSAQYGSKLSKLYNETQGGTNEYLDALHVKFTCCGVSGMMINPELDRTSFQLPGYDAFTKIPKSCCAELEENECTDDHIYSNTCDAAYSIKVKVFDFVMAAFLFGSLIWKVLLIFSYRKHSDQLFTRERL